MNRITAPFTPDQVQKLNSYQQKGSVHEFTCCSPEDIPECTRACKEVNGEIIAGTSRGVLTATADGWICPCGQYTQNWAYDFMLK